MLAWKLMGHHSLNNLGHWVMTWYLRTELSHIVFLFISQCFMTIPITLVLIDSMPSWHPTTNRSSPDDMSDMSPISTFNSLIWILQISILLLWMLVKCKNYNNLWISIRDMRDVLHALIIERYMWLVRTLISLSTASKRVIFINIPIKTRFSCK